MTVFKICSKKTIFQNYFRKQLANRPLMSCLKTHSNGMTIISDLKFKGSKWKRHKRSYCNWKFTNYQIPIQSSMTKFENLKVSTLKKN